MNYKQKSILKQLKRDYKEALKNEYVDTVICKTFWQHFSEYFTDYIKDWKNPNPHDTRFYDSLKPSEQASVQCMFIDSVLNGDIDLEKHEPKMAKEEKDKQLVEIYEQSFKEHGI